jgi:cellulose synthase operon protein C
MDVTSEAGSPIVRSMRRSSRVRRDKKILAALLAGALAAVGSAAFAPPAAAQGLAVGPAHRVPVDDDDSDVAARDIPRRGTLRGSFGVPVAERLLVSSSADERLRGVLRLGAIGTPEAIDALVDAFEQSSILGRDGRARLEAVRILAHHAGRDTVRPLLVRELSEAGPEGRAGGAALGNLSRAAAALALAKTGDKKAQGALVAAVLQGGPGGEAASDALSVFPPTSLATLIEGRRRIEPGLAVLLADLGDVRALGKLRQALEETDVATRQAAALALARLGDTTPLALARTWVKAEEPRQRRVGAEVMVRLGATGAAEAITALLEGSATRLDGVRLALAAPSPALVKPLVAAIEALPAEERDKAVAALGRIGGVEAAEALVQKLARPELATGAAYALARLPGKEGRAALERALASVGAKKGGPRRLIARTAILRSIVMGEEPAGLGAVLGAMAAEKEPADRAVSLFGRVATGRTSVRDAVDEACASGGTCDVGLVAAAARASLARGPEGPAEFARVLSRLGPLPYDAPSPLIVAAGVALLADPRAPAFPTALLARWAEGGGPLAPLAARALPSRDEEALRGRIKRLLEGTDPVIRAHTALGLALDPEPDAASLLVAAYRFEEDVSVRRAVVRALSERRESQRTRTLELARDLDPDDGVRALARAALAGRSLAVPSAVSGGSVVWVSLVANAPSALAAIGGRAGRLARVDGVVVPVVADPDGVLVVPGLPEGRAALMLAPEAVPGDAAAP